MLQASPPQSLSVVHGTVGAGEASAGASTGGGGGGITGLGCGGGGSMDAGTPCMHTCAFLPAFV